MWEAFDGLPEPLKWAGMAGFFFATLILAFQRFRIVKRDQPIGEEDVVEILNGIRDVVTGMAGTVATIKYNQDRQERQWERAEAKLDRLLERPSPAARSR